MCIIECTLELRLGIAFLVKKGSFIHGMLKLMKDINSRYAISAAFWCSMATAGGVVVAIYLVAL